MLGDLLREWNVLGEAAQAVGQGIEHARQSGFAKALAIGLVILARIRQAQGRREEAAHLVRQCEQLVHQEAATTLAEGSTFLRLVHLWILQGNLDAAFRWAEHYRRALQSDGSSHSLYAQEGITLAQLLLAQSGRGSFLVDEQPLKEALSLLEHVRACAQARGEMRNVLEALVLQAQVEHAQSHLSEALCTLQEALTLAEPEGYVRLFVDGGPLMAELLQQVAEAFGASPYITSLLEALGIPAELAHTPAPATLVDALSEREVEVLRLLARGGSNCELAQALVVSTSTVKTHLQHIYSKLGVSNRRQAVARAQELHL